ncbi:MAG: class I SAM-dependent methyltransferase [Microthrixaceae bacterium]
MSPHLPSDPYADFAGWYHWLLTDRELAEGALGPAANATLDAMPVGSRIHDAACGIGVDALALCQRGFRTSGSDISRSMIAEAERRTAASDCHVPFSVAGWDTLGDLLTAPVAAVLCTGNSLAQVRSDDDLTVVLGGLRDALQPAGLVIVDAGDYPAVAGEFEPDVRVVHRSGQRALVSRRWRIRSSIEDPQVLDISIETGSGPQRVEQLIRLWPRSTRELELLLRGVGLVPEVMADDAALGRHTIVARRQG